MSERLAAILDTIGRFFFETWVLASDEPIRCWMVIGLMIVLLFLMGVIIRWWRER
jgi:hypothetical protein